MRLAGWWAARCACETACFPLGGRVGDRRAGTAIAREADGGEDGVGGRRGGGDGRADGAPLAARGLAIGGEGAADVADAGGSVCGRVAVRPPQDHRFDAVALDRAIRYTAQRYGFGDIVSALTDAIAETRLSALTHLYRFRMERRTLFCLSAALRIDQDLRVIGNLCDFYSRYLSHPESPFGVDSHLSSYARAMLAEFPEAQLLRILEAFSDEEEEDGGWDGAVEIFGLAEEEIWTRHDVINRGSLQQGIAQVIRYASTPRQLLSVVANPRVSLNQRRGAVALFGYLGYTCNTDELDSLIAEASDAPLCALFTWLRYWIVTELEDLRH